MIRYFKAVSRMLMILAVAGSTSAQFDPIGTVDVVYIDSVEAGPGQDIPITFGVRNGFRHNWRNSK